jgi:hypothetical protein
LVDGFLLINLSVSLTLKRKKKNEDYDYLIAKLILKKGDRGGAGIRVIEFRNRHGTNQEVKTVDTIQRQEIVKTERGKPWTVTWDKQDKSQHFLRLAPNESTQFSQFWQVPKDAECTVDVVVVAKRNLSFRRGQWRREGPYELFRNSRLEP